MAEVFNLTQEEQDSLQELLKSEKLCYNDISEDGVKLYGVKIKHVHVGYFGFEQFATNALFEMKSAKYVLINVGYWILTFALMGGLLNAWV